MEAREFPLAELKPIKLLGIYTVAMPLIELPMCRQMHQ